MSPKQIALIHVAKKRLGLDDDMYRAILYKLGGVMSAKDLNAAGFEAVMEYFTACGFRSDWTHRTFGRRPGMASPAQVDLIKSLWSEYTGRDDEAALNKWLERSFHVSALRFLPASMAQKAITGLKRMKSRNSVQPSGEHPSPAA